MKPPPAAPQYQYFTLTHPTPYVSHVEIYRPESLNSFIEPMWLELRKVFAYLSDDPSTRVVLLSGAGPKAFTTGLDVKVASQSILSPQIDTNSPVDAARKAMRTRRHVADFQDCISSIERCEKPVISAMHGYCLGLAIDISTCADVRICASDAIFSVKEVDIGLAADIGTLSRLPKVVGNYSWVKDVCLSARLFGAEEAKGVGFVSGVVVGGREEVVREGIKWAELVAGKSPVAVQGTKELLNWSRDHPVADGLRYTGVWNSAMLQSDDVTTAMTAGMKKKTPTFEKL